MKRVFYILFASLLFVTFVIVQMRSIVTVEDSVRDGESDVFREIIIMKQKNLDLEHEISDLELAIEQLEDQNLSLLVVESEIEKYLKLSGRSSVFGPGVSVTVEGDIALPWFIDISNELFGMGAQAVSVNNIRLSNLSSGFDVLPQGQILLNGSIISPPYTFRAIGESELLESSLLIPGGILSRLGLAYPELVFDVDKNNIIQMK